MSGAPHGVFRVDPAAAVLEAALEGVWPVTRVLVKPRAMTIADVSAIRNTRERAMALIRDLLLVRTPMLALIIVTCHRRRLEIGF
jgi:hypothetical protein